MSAPGKHIGLFACCLLVACESNTEDRLVVGQLESDRIEITAEFAEPIVSLLVTEGQQVSKSAPLIRQNTERAEARVLEAEALVTENQARLSELLRGPREEKIAAARANVEGASKELSFRLIELQRTERLLERELAAPGELDSAKAAHDNALARLGFVTASLDEMLSGTTVEELDQTRASLMRAKAQLELLRIDLQRHTAIAPQDSIVDSLLFEPGERPAPGEPMAILLGGQQPYARVYVPEVLRVTIAPGAAALVFIDGIASPLKGRVRWVSHEAAFTPYFALTEHDRGRLSYLAKIDLDVSGARLPDGVPVEVKLGGTMAAKK